MKLYYFLYLIINSIQPLFSVIVKTRKNQNSFNSNQSFTETFSSTSSEAESFSATSKEAFFSKHTLTVHSELYSLQFPTSFTTSDSFCNDPNRSFLVLELGKEEQINGFAAIFQFAASALAIAHALNRTLVEIIPEISSVTLSNDNFIEKATEFIYHSNKHDSDPWTRSPTGACAGRKLSCFFEPISACAFYPSVLFPIDKIPILNASSILTAQLQRNQRIVRINSISKSRPLILAATRGDFSPLWVRELNNCQMVNSTSSLLLHSPCRVPQWFPAVQSFLFKPVSRIYQLLGKDVINSMWKSRIPSFAVHIRRGDAVTLDWRSHATADEYINALIPLKNVFMNDKNDDIRKQINITLSKDHVSSFSSLSFPLYIATDSMLARMNAKNHAIYDGSFTLLSTPAQLLLSHSNGLTKNDEIIVNTEQFLRAFMSSTPLPSIEEVDKKDNVDEPLEEYTIDAIRQFNASIYEEFTDAMYTLMIKEKEEEEERQQMNTTDNDDENKFIKQHELLLRHLSSAFSTRDMTDGVIADILAMSHATFLVGTCFSQVSRLASELRISRAYQKIHGNFAHIVPFPQFLALDTVTCRSFPYHSYTITIDWRESFDLWVN